MRARPRASGQRATAIVGQSPSTIRLRAEIERIAPFSSSVLITGPSGTGKELVAREIHRQSPRALGPFIPVDCASMSGELMASQLFGHVAGAFTGANCAALGCFRAASSGTLFLDEIGELDYSLQAKLLRVLQDHVVAPLGSPRGEHVDVRVVAATNRNLRADVAAGRFREDLYYRLDVVHLSTRALSERPGDIHDLAAAFLGQLAHEGLPECTLSSQAVRVLVEFHWPGNVRQLRNVLEQAAIESDGLIAADLLRRIISLSFASEESADGEREAHFETTSGSHHSPRGEAQTKLDDLGTATSETLEWQTLAQLERTHIALTLKHTFYNRSAAARLLGVTRQALIRKMKRYGLDL